MEKVIVTGALGFIGFSLCQRLLEEGIEVIGIDGMVDKSLKSFYDEKLLWIGRNAQFTFIDQRIEDMNIKKIMKDVDVIYHLAATTSRNRQWQDLRTTIEDNVGVTDKVINACNKKTKLIFTSSTQVYGERTGLITEKTPLNPTTPYSLTKMAAESLIKTKCQERKVPYVIFRLPTIYGPWQRVDMTYSRLIVNQLTGLENEVDLDRATEDVLYVNDILDTLFSAGRTKDCQNTIYNLATGKSNEWFRGRKLINEKLVSEPIDERLEVMISFDKAQNELDFQVTTKIEDGIQCQKDHIKKYWNLYLK